MLDPETFTREPGDIFWRFHTTERLGQFDIAVPADDAFAPSGAALANLQTALTNIDALYDTALAAAETGWAARYNAPLRSRDAWSLIRLFADDAGRLVLSLNEGDIDTYCLWDITLIAGRPIQTDHRVWGASPAH